MRHSVIGSTRTGRCAHDHHSDCLEHPDYEATRALPGTREKLAVLAQRIALGLPLWHPQDRLTYDEGQEEGVHPQSIHSS